MMKLPFARKSLGQHWLNDLPSLQAISDAAQITDTDVVLEIGPGPGALTELLIKRAKQVVAVELDQKLAEQLTRKLPAPNLQVIQQDILRFDFRALPPGYKIVANIPYYLTGKLLRLLSETPNPPAIAALLVQKEVAERVAALPGNLSILSVTTQFYWQTNLDRLVPAELFTPPPKVDSQILQLLRRPRPLFDVDSKEFFTIVKAGFAQPRKTLLNNLSAGLRYSRDEAQAVCERASLDSSRRPQTLSLQEWYQLYRAIHT